MIIIDYRLGKLLAATEQSAASLSARNPRRAEIDADIDFVTTVRGCKRTEEQQNRLEALFAKYMPGGAKP